MYKFGLKIIPYSDERWLFKDGKTVAFKWLTVLITVYLFEILLFFVFGYGNKAFVLTFLVSLLWEVIKGVYARPGFSMRSVIVYVLGVIIAGLDWQIFHTFF
jgi:hypothetical protein